MPRNHPTPHLNLACGGPLNRDASGLGLFPWLLVGLMLVTGCGEKQGATGSAAAGGGDPGAWHTRDWPVTRGGKELQGRVQDPVPRQPVVEWTYQAKGAVTSEAAISNDTVVFGDAEGVVYAVDFLSGKERWRDETKDAVEATPAIAGQRVFVGSNDGVFRALELQTGRQLWQIEGREKFPTGAVVADSPDGKEQWILVNGYDGVLRCLRAKDGAEVWKHETQDYINGTPAILDGGLVAFGGCDAVIHVIRLQNGHGVNRLATDAQIIRSLAGWGTTVYGVNHADQLVAAGAAADQPAWVYEDEGAQFLTSPAVDEARVYVGSRDKHLHAVDRLNGKPVWKFKTGGRVESSPLVFDDAVVFGSNDGRLYAVDPRDGREIWRLELGEGLAVAPAFAAGRIVIGGGEGTLFVIRGGGTK